MTDIVLIGGGHAQLFVLEAFARRPEPGVRLTLVAKEVDAPYSGMLPGFVAGHYGHDDIHVDLVRLSERAGARLIQAAAVGIDRAARRARVEGHPSLPYDLLSIDVGITPDLSGIVGAAAHGLIVKPISTFAPKWRALEAQVFLSGGPRRFAVVGGGAAGFELALAVRHRLRLLDHVQIHLIAGDGLFERYNHRAQRLGRVALRERHVGLIEHDLAVEIANGAVRLGSGRVIEADATLIATGAAAPPWFQTTGLPLDPAGYLALRPTLQVEGDDAVFAAGDCATVLDHPREKAGVFAVRQGPVLARNLRRVARGEAARPFVPQRAYLSLLSLGEKAAIAAKGPLAAEGRWIWRWKDWIDRRFVARFKKI